MSVNLHLLATRTAFDEVRYEARHGWPKVRTTKEFLSTITTGMASGRGIMDGGDKGALQIEVIRDVATIMEEKEAIAGGPRLEQCVQWGSMVMYEGVECLLSNGVRGVPRNDTIIEVGVNRGRDGVYHKGIVGEEEIVVEKGSSYSGIENFIGKEGNVSIVGHSFRRCVCTGDSVTLEHSGAGTVTQTVVKLG